MKNYREDDLYSQTFGFSLRVYPHFKTHMSQAGDGQARIFRKLPY